MDIETLQNNVVAVAAIAALIGLFIGWLVTYLLIGRGPSKSELTDKLASVEEEFETHKKKVDKHFVTTSELVNELTESYVKVYKHLSDGAETLSGVVDMRNRLTLDDAPDNTHERDVIEGAVSHETTPPEVSTELLRASDPEYTISEEAVQETLAELEVNSAKAVKTKTVNGFSKDKTATARATT